MVVGLTHKVLGCLDLTLALMGYSVLCPQPLLEDKGAFRRSVT